MKKQLSILAGSVLLASSANAALTDTDSAAVLVLVGANGSFAYDTGLTSGQLAGGQGFSLDVSAGLGSVGALSGYALFGTLACDDPACAGTNGYADAGLGFVAASNAGVSIGSGDVSSTLQAIDNYINFLAGGGFGAQANGTFGDADTQAALVNNGLIVNGVNQLFTSTESDTNNDLSPSGPIPIVDPGGALEGVYLDGNTFNVTNAAIPVPAAAWLFGSALVGLGVVRRKS